MSGKEGGVVAARFRLLGQVAVDGADGPIEIGGATARAVLAALLLRADAGASADDLIAMVWGGDGGATRDSVYHYISALRRVLAAAGVELQTRRPRYRLVVASELVDWYSFRQLVTQARAAREKGLGDRAVPGLRTALKLWQGEPLADIGERLSTYRRDMSQNGSPRLSCWPRSKPARVTTLRWLPCCGIKS